MMVKLTRNSVEIGDNMSKCSKGYEMSMIIHFVLTGDMLGKHDENEFRRY